MNPRAASDPFRVWAEEPAGNVYDARTINAQAASRLPACKTSPPRRAPASLIVQSLHCTIFPGVNRLTRQEQLVLCLVCAFLLVGWAVKTYRTSHPADTAQTLTPPSGIHPKN